MFGALKSNTEKYCLQVYDDRETFGRYCGSDQFPVIKTTLNVLHVDLQTDGSPGTEMKAYYATTGNYNWMLFAYNCLTAQNLTFANTIDSDQSPQNAVFDQSCHYLS